MDESDRYSACARNVEEKQPGIVANTSMSGCFQYYLEVDDCMKKYNYIVSILMMVLSGYILFETGTYEIGQSAQKNPAVWPRFLAVALIILSVVLIVQTIFSHNPEMESFSIDWKGTGMRKVYIMFGLTIGFVVVLKVLGMLIALLLLIPAIEWLLGCRSKVMMIALPVGLVVFVYVFFGIIMKLTLPGPFWA
ncbi:tripartite tricarboxylate transporter TctB family protein [bacterium 1XD21-13]|nr:tripartite tricarboxylate transporter TctB family protein [bacterium 1XD21-13]